MEPDEYLVVVVLLLLLLPLLLGEVLEVEVTTEESGTVPVGSKPLDLFRLAKGHPDVL